MRDTHTRIVVTGAQGLIGSALSEALARHPGAEVTAFARRRSEFPLRTIVLNLTDERSIAAALEEARPHLIFHAAGRVHGTAAELFRDNTAATATLADAVLKVCPDAVLTALGSAAEYGRPVGGGPLSEDAPFRPISIYGHAKAAAARYLAYAAERGLRYNMLRIFNPIGPVNSTNQVLGSFIAKALQARTDTPPRIVRMGRLDSIRDFIALDDLVRLALRVVDTREAGLVVNVCSGQGRPVRDLVHFVQRVSGLDLIIQEEGPAPGPSSPPDAVVGDPTRFRALAGLDEFTSVEETLATAWRLADAENHAFPSPRGDRAEAGSDKAREISTLHDAAPISRP